MTQLTIHPGIQDKKTGNKFVYETYSVKDPTTGKAVTKKKYLGRVDPETGEIIPKGESGKRNRKLSTIAREEASRKDRSEIDALNSTIADLSVKTFAARTGCSEERSVHKNHS